MYTCNVQPFYSDTGKRVGWAVVVSNQDIGWTFTIDVYPHKAQAMAMAKQLTAGQGYTPMHNGVINKGLSQALQLEQTA